MGRWLDDGPHMPAGMERIGYDSDTQRYTFRDSDGCIYEGNEYGGTLTLISRPQKGQDDEPIRLMPNSPPRLQTKVKGVPESWTSATSFHDILPSQKIVCAPPPEPPRRKATVKGPSSPLQRSKTTSSQRSLWNTVYGAAVSSKPSLREVVESVTRRRSSNSKTSPGHEHGRDESYARLSEQSDTRFLRPPHSRGHMRGPSV
ncbi:uncharacterized protein PHACADRAFT_249166 [Phanerochaete carnosa HHB-10118-sp]|uniref:Carbohydrate-binding module family 50 protein n=1 Tax=Phanerochaete carnosa (strain HHB-10118-sp) TaxID=650164 RepID=K5X814_PHACS|nr:uncharacterized protein PHACADRAFT_249166 [Phanerochaete carnosa HHB-10118-sp]EKM59012.1 hypothetical protein PHACADRAFT_249166 [Phanerochaete carnosa HHB-10118-sp]